MKIDLEKGKYIVAVSGGVDSMTLLDILRKNSTLELVVAHFNHGIRKDSGEDEELVKKIAEKYTLIFEVGYGQLGANASEARARQARYEFLEEVRKKHNSKAIITAQHQDDLIETAFINILRGTGRKGLSSFTAKNVLRPMMSMTKSKVIKYAKQNNLLWHEDSTNQETKILRNYLRLKVVPKLSATQKQELIENLIEAKKINETIDDELLGIEKQIISDGKINRQRFAQLPSEVANELLIVWLAKNGVRQVPRAVVRDVSSFIKTGRSESSKKIKNAQGILLDKKFANWG